jgi:hypothetical protein
MLRAWLFRLFESESFLGHLSFEKQALKLLVNSCVHVDRVALAHLTCQIIHLALVNNQHCLTGQDVGRGRFSIHNWRLRYEHWWWHYKVLLILHSSILEINFRV